MNSKLKIRAAALDAMGVEVLNESPETNATGEWPAPIPLTSAEPLPFPRTLIPAAVGAFAESLAEHTETPRELAAMLCLAVSSAAVAGRYEVEVHDGYIEPTNIFVAAALESGNRKTAVFNAARQPLTEFEQEEKDRLEPERRRAISERKTVEAAIDRLRKKIGSSNDREIRIQLQTLEESLVEIPEFPRLRAQDITPESLAALTSRNGERMAILSDEGGYFDILAGRYSRGVPNLDFVLHAHAGAPVRVDRKSAEAVFLNKPLLTIGLSPQPAVLSGLSQTPGFRGRGLLARFLYAMPQSNLGYRNLEPRPIPGSIRSDYSKTIRNLLSIPIRIGDNGRAAPIRLTFAPSAYDSWRDLQQMVEIEMREGSRLAELKDWGGKLPSAAARIAGVLHCVEMDPKTDLEISRDTIERALTLTSILIPHALLAFGLMNSDGVEQHARRIIKWAKEQRRPEFAARNVFCAFQSTFRTMENMEPVLSILEKHSYIRIREQKTGGRPSRLCQVNPAILEE